ncbi:MAG: hypothetical protein WCJ35_12310 [Planctomycetota bacterium]
MPVRPTYCSFLFVILVLSGTVRVSTAEKPSLQRLAAKEVARYLYVRTGLLPEKIAEQGKIVVVRKDAARLSDTAVLAAAQDLRPQQYVLKTTVAEGKKTWWIVGGDDLGTLYGAYRFAEKLGVRFYLHGDVIPDRHLARIPDMDETGKPLFALRGVNPWGSHPFGFDAWGSDDYKAIFTQLAKMRMNFLGIHCYPEGHPYAEPTVWHGMPGDFDLQGRVKASYPSHYYNTLVKGEWGPILPKKTGDYSFGGALLFDRDDWAPEVMRGHCPVPSTPEGCNEVFNRMAAQFREAFGFARRLGVKTCIGTEAPLILPLALQKRIKAQGKNPKDPATVREIYESTFRRIMASHPLDYYWIWTPEDWTWAGNKPQQYETTVRDLKLAYEVSKKVNAPFQLATCGWVLGPQHDRAAMDADLPKDMPASAISRTLGYTEVDPAYARIRGREKWAIPWLESDGNHGLAAVQLVAGRMRRDAADASAYGCTGLMGLHWRSDILGPNIAALAEAAWDQPRTKTAVTEKKNRSLPCDDFYADWAEANFGPEASAAIGKLFASIDGKVSISVGDGCPSGSLAADTRLWPKVGKPYAFIDELALLRPQVTGPGNLDRFDYWLNIFRYHRILAQVRCALGVFETAMKQVTASDPAVRRKQAESTALPAYREVLRLYGEAYHLLLATVNTPGGLATVVNLENHAEFLPVAIGKPAARLTAALGGPLPSDAIPPVQYQGEPRIIVPTVRTLIAQGEPLRLKIIVLDNQPARTVTVLWRPLGIGPFRAIPLTHIARAVYEAELPTPEKDFEYRIEATTASGVKLMWPATAPEINQTVVLWED